MAKLPTPSWQQLFTQPVHMLAFGFGTGLAPKAPGTVGTLVGIPFALLLMPLGVISYLVITAFMFLVGIWICDRSSNLLGVHDHGGIVWDEIVGYLVTFAPIVIWPNEVGWDKLPLWGWVVVAFFWFRVFDILKPWPIKLLDKHVGGGFGIMVDDLLAGVFAAAIFMLPVLMA